MIEDDGDIVRGLGFVTMYGAHLERQIDELLHLLSHRFVSCSKVQKQPISKKIKLAKRALLNIDNELIAQIIKTLEDCGEHFKWRNELVHGRIYSPYYLEYNLQFSRENVTDRRVTSDELYTLANNFSELESEILRIIQFSQLATLIGAFK